MEVDLDGLHLTATTFKQPQLDLGHSGSILKNGNLFQDFHHRNVRRSSGISHRTRLQ